MKLKNLLLGALVWAISTLSTTTYAIENLTVAVQGSNAVLSWPASQWYDTFIVRYRPNLNATSSWQTLDNAYPADQNGNPTVFVHSNSVVYLPPGPSGSGGGGPPSPGPGGTNTVTMGNGAPSFYQVVKVGVHLYGITNGMVLSGAVPLPIEFGNNDTNQVLSAVYLQDQDESALPGAFFGWTIDDAATNRITGLWDTTSVTNGTYTIAVGATLSGSQVVDDSVTVTVSNLVWFPDPWTVAGTAIYMGAQSVFTNGIWHMDFFDDQHRYLGYLDGPVDGDGWCNVAGDPGPGFSVGITDTNGVQLPSTNYTVEVTVKASSAVNAAQTKVVKQHVVEPSWNDLNTQSVTAYKQLNDNDESLTYLAVKGMADLVWSIQTGFIRMPSTVQARLTGCGDRPNGSKCSSIWALRIIFSLATFSISATAGRTCLAFIPAWGKVAPARSCSNT
jgi:hypothetical protein